MTRKKLIRAFSLTMALLLTISSTACTKKYDGKNKWIDSNLPENTGSLSGIRLEDDFAAATCADWLEKQTYDPYDGNGSFKTAGRIVTEKKRELLNDTSVTDKNLELLRAFDGLYSDWDKRDELGAEPVRKYLERIDTISSLKDAEDYMLENDNNPFAVMLLQFGTVRAESKKDHFCLRVSQPSYSLGVSSIYALEQSEIEKKQENVTAKVSLVMKKLGYSDEEIRNTVSDCISFESKMAAINPGGDQLLYNAQIDGKEAFLARSSSLDLERILDHYQLGSTVNYTGDLTYLDGIDSIFTEDNLSGIKAYFKVCLILNSLQLLDKDTFDQTEILKLDPTNPYATVSVAAPDRYLFKTIRTSPLCGAMEQAYLDRYFDQRVYDDVYGILEELRDGYKEIIEEKDWLSSENKEKVKEKLDAMIFNVMKPSNEADYGDMTFSSYEEGGTLLDAYCKLNCFKIRHYGEITQMDYDRGFWDIYDTKSPTTQVGDQYDGGRNSIVVMIGILEEDIYSYDMTYEEKLGSIGTVLGHEMSHAFDSEGIYQDKNGDYTNLIEEKDLRRFNQKAAKVTEYFSGIQPFEDSDGYPSDNNLSSEAIADMGGMSVALRIADKKTDFDYDLFFRSFSRLWRRLTLKGDQIDSLRNDKHPLAYLRVNITVQQFDKFYETYNIQPGDNMYLPPKERIAIW